MATRLHTGFVCSCLLLRRYPTLVADPGNGAWINSPAFSAASFNASRSAFWADADGVAGAGALAYSVRPTNATLLIIGSGPGVTRVIERNASRGYAAFIMRSNTRASNLQERSDKICRNVIRALLCETNISALHDEGKEEKSCD